MSTRNLMTAVIGGLLLAPTLALAADFYEVVNGEKGIVFKDAPSTVTRDQVRAEMKSGNATASRWLHVGGESGWTLAPPIFVLEGGKLVHAADCPLLASAAAP